MGYDVWIKSGITSLGSVAPLVSRLSIPHHGDSMLNMQHNRLDGAIDPMYALIMP